MNSYVALSVRDAVGIVTIDRPPVNALSPGVPEGLEACLREATGEPAVKAVVIIGAGRTFIAGADINELADGGAGPDLHGLLQRMEDSPKPVVAALHGTALGGGLEIAMAAHYRVASPDAQLGLPELNLGIIPGAEGTQRLPRLVGAEKALEMCISGAPIRAREALEIGLVDHIVEGDSLLDGAIRFALEAANRGGPHPKTRDRDEKSGSDLENLLIFAVARERAAKLRKNQTASLKLIEAMEAAISLPFSEGCRRERELCATCLASPQAKAMIHAFLSEREVAKISDLPKDTQAYPLRKAAIIGAGTMGGGIAMALANAGIPVLLSDSNQAALDRGIANIRKNYESSVKRGRLTHEAVARRIALIHPQTGLAGFGDVDVIIEAVFESMDLKKEIFAEIDRVAASDCVLASNTSTLDIDEISGATSRPHMVIGLHFFSPAHVMRLLEIVRGKATSPRVVATGLALAKSLRKVGVVVGNGFGFVGNRMMFPYMREAQFLVEEGATPAQVDAALTEWGMAMGIFAVDDMGGLDLAARVFAEIRRMQGPGQRMPIVLDRLVAMGRLGQKTGAGWYRYDETRKSVRDPEVEALIEQAAAGARIPRRAISVEEILDRCLFSMINEGAKILEEGKVQRASDIDTIYLTGYGFPAYRGGPMWYADAVGLGKVLRRVKEFNEKFGPLWKPAPLLDRLAAEGKTFAALDKDRYSVEKQSVAKK